MRVRRVFNRKRSIVNLRLKPSSCLGLGYCSCLALLVFRFVNILANNSCDSASVLLLLFLLLLLVVNQLLEILL